MFQTERNNEQKSTMLSVFANIVDFIRIFFGGVKGIFVPLVAAALIGFDIFVNVDGLRTLSSVPDWVAILVGCSVVAITIFASSKLIPGPNEEDDTDKPGPRKLPRWVYVLVLLPFALVNFIASTTEFAQKEMAKPWQQDAEAARIGGARAATKAEKTAVKALCTRIDRELSSTDGECKRIEKEMSREEYGDGVRKGKGPKYNTLKDDKNRCDTDLKEWRAVKKGCFSVETAPDPNLLNYQRLLSSARELEPSIEDNELSQLVKNAQQFRDAVPAKTDPPSPLDLFRWHLERGLGKAPWMLWMYAFFALLIECGVIVLSATQFARIRSNLDSNRSFRPPPVKTTPHTQQSAEQQELARARTLFRAPSLGDRVHARRTIRELWKSIEKRRDLGARLGAEERQVLLLAKAMDAHHYLHDGDVKRAAPLFDQLAKDAMGLSDAEDWETLVSYLNSQVVADLDLFVQNPGSRERLLRLLQKNPPEHYEPSARGDAYGTLGMAAVLEGRPDEAIKHLQEALKINGRNAQNLTWLGLAQVRSGNIQDAEASLASAKEFFSGQKNPSKYYGAWLQAEIALAGGMLGPAREAWKIVSAQARDPYPRELVRAIEIVLLNQSTDPENKKAAEQKWKAGANALCEFAKERSPSGEATTKVLVAAGALAGAAIHLIDSKRLGKEQAVSRLRPALATLPKTLHHDWDAQVLPVLNNLGKRGADQVHALKALASLTGYVSKSMYVDASG